MGQIAYKILLSAGMAELVDAPDLGSGSERSEGSSPFTRTTNLYALLDS